MGMTIAEKIIAAAAGVDSVKPGDIHTVQLDRLMSNDGTTHLTVDMYNNKLKNPHIADTKKLVFIVDHNVPSDCPKTAASQKKMRDFAKENNIDFWEGKGVCHQVMIENYVRPGELIFGADSHTCSYGALGAFGTGVGCTDFLYGMVTGTSWVLVPESVKFNLTGKLPEGVTARDLILTIIGEVGANGCNYQVMEFTGEGAKTLSISDRMTLCNMAVEAGAKTGIFEADEKAMEYLKEHGREPKAVFHSDPDAKYVREYTFDLSKVRPVVAKPDFVDNVVPAEEACGIEINEAFLGSCNNGRIEDLRVGAEIIKGKKVSDKVRFLVVPASQTIYRQALKEGLIDIFGGLQDIEAKMIRCVGDPEERFGEDALRIMRAIRFSAQLGYEIHEDTEAAIRKLAPTLQKISAERIQVELTKLLISPHPDTLRDAYDMGVTKVILPEFDAMMETPQKHKHHKYNVGEHTLHALIEIAPEKDLRYAILLHDIGKPETLTVDEDGTTHFHGHPAVGEEMARRILRRLRFDNDTVAVVTRLVRYHDYGNDVTPDLRIVRRAVNKIGEDIFPLLFPVRHADILAQSDYLRAEKLENLELWKQLYEEMLEKKQCVSLKTLAVTGRDLIAMGMKPGRELGDMLQKLLELVLEHPEQNTREQLLEKAGELAAGKE